MKETRTKTLRKIGSTVGVMALVILLLLSSYQTNQLGIKVNQFDEQLGAMSDSFSELSENYTELSEDYARLSADYRVAVQDLAEAQRVAGRYTGNPFTTELWSGQMQSENISGMHWYTYLDGSLENRSDVLAYPRQDGAYTVFAVDGEYFVKNGSTGQIDFSGINFTLAANYAFDHLTSNRNWFERVVFIGNFTVGISASMNPTNWTEVYAYSASFFKDYPGANTPILKAEDIVRLRMLGGYYNGSKDHIGALNNNHGAYGIFIENSALTRPPGPTIELMDVYAGDCYDDVIHIRINSGNMIRLTRVSVMGVNTHTAFNLSGGDSYVWHCNAQSTRENFYWTGGRVNLMSFYAGGTCTLSESAIYINGHRDILTDINVDNCYKIGILINGKNDGIIKGVNFIMKDNPNSNTYTALKLHDAKNWTITDSKTTQYTGDTWKYKYAIEENGTSSGNWIHGNDFEDIGTSAFYGLSATTVTHDNPGGNEWKNATVQILVFANVGGQNQTVNTARYIIPFTGKTTYSTSVTNAQIFLPKDGYLAELRVQATAHPTIVGNVTVNINGGDTGVQAVITAGEGTGWYNDTGSVAVSEGDLLSIKLMAGTSSWILRIVQVYYYYDESS